MVTVGHKALVVWHRCKVSGSEPNWSVFPWCPSHIWATLSLNAGQQHDQDVLLKPTISQFWKYSETRVQTSTHSSQGAFQHLQCPQLLWYSVHSIFAVFPIFSFPNPELLSNWQHRPTLDFSSWASSTSHLLWDLDFKCGSFLGLSLWQNF